MHAVGAGMGSDQHFFYCEGTSERTRKGKLPAAVLASMRDSELRKKGWLERLDISLLIWSYKVKHRQTETGEEGEQR